MAVATPAFLVDRLVKDYPGPQWNVRVRAVDGLSLRVPANCIYGLVGPNGSGKSTTIKALLGLARPAAGRLEVWGRPAGDRETRRRLGYLPEGPFYPRQLTGRELARLHGLLGGLDGAAAERRAQELLERVGLAEAADRKLAGYSKGMLQRVGLAQALVHDPDTLILDEPTAGVDPVGVAEIAQLIRDLKAEGKTILLCSHLLAHVERLCDEVAVLARGRLMASGPLESLAEADGKRTVLVSELDEAQAARMRELAAEWGARASPALPRGGLEGLLLRLLEREKEREPESGSPAAGRKAGQ